MKQFNEKHNQGQTVPTKLYPSLIFEWDSLRSACLDSKTSVLRRNTMGLGCSCKRVGCDKKQF